MKIVRICLVIVVMIGQQAFAQTVDELMSEIDSALPSLNIDGGSSVPRGQLRPVNFTLISAGIDAKLEKFPVRMGSRVEAGEVIAEFNCKIEEASHSIELAREVVSEKNFSINQRLSQLNNISDLELSISESELDISRAEVKRTSSVLSECVVRAPFDGTVTEKFVEAYQYVNKGELLVEIIDTENLEVEMVLPSLNLSQYQVGRKFDFLIDETGQRIGASIDRIVNVIDPVSQTVRVIGVLDKPSSGLMPGMSGIVVVE